MQLDVNIPAPFTPIFLPHKPEIKALNSGKKSINIYIFSQSRIPAGLVKGGGSPTRAGG